MIDDYEMLKRRCAKLNDFGSLKVIQVLEVLSCCTTYESIANIADVSGLSSSTVHRILNELVITEYVNKNDDRKYRLGLNALALGSRIRKNDIIQEASDDEMDRLNELSLETIHLIVLDKMMGRYIAKREAKNSIGLRSRIGWTLPLHCSSGGKCLMAYQSEEWLRNYFQSPMKRFTDNTICDEDAMRKELEAIRNQGYALDNCEHNPDVICIASPIFDSQDNVIATIGISAPSYRFPIEKALSFKDEVMKSARIVTEILRKK